MHRETLTAHPSFGGAQGCPCVCPADSSHPGGALGTALPRCKTALNSSKDPQSTALIRAGMSQLHESPTPSHTQGGKNISNLRQSHSAAS